MLTSTSAEWKWWPPSPQNLHGSITLNEKKRVPWCSVVICALFPQITMFIFMPLKSAQPGAVCITHRTSGSQETVHFTVTLYRQWRAVLCIGEAKRTKNHCEVFCKLYTLNRQPFKWLTLGYNMPDYQLVLPKTEKTSLASPKSGYYNIKEERRETRNGNSYLWSLLPSTGVSQGSLLSLEPCLLCFLVSFRRRFTCSSESQLWHVTCLLSPIVRI